ncbi:beta-galactosidase-1-like protein 3 isoform X1 [Biomphalaria glabrata]|uniref:Beta-galactosidase-1-like protein 3 isoform X1 n=1 Tax=Biomphalaria glabrata TaxID=6526 RepID=A0A9W2YUV4_BIOGL|nr:beta-galactosidase-1-like protein 3 isoform X1 [Biomphalaria glabrata]
MRKKTILKLATAILVTVLIWIVWFASTLDSEGDHLMLDSVANERVYPYILDNDRNIKYPAFHNLSYTELLKFDSKNLFVNKSVHLPENLKMLEIPTLNEGIKINNGSLNNDSLENIVQGLTFYNKTFYLNNKPFRIFSGSVHYFRIVPEYWKDRLLKLKACGLNTVETYVPWNLHEPSPGVFKFEGILNLRAFIQLAADLGLFVILRPGPYICSEMDFGGLPGWLLRDPNMKVRSNYPGYISAVNKYFSILLPYVHNLQFTEGGPIIMYQVENEINSYSGNIEHLKLITFLLKSLKVKELLVTSDHRFQDSYAHNKNIDFTKYALLTDNLKDFRDSSYQLINKLNRHFPYMVMELWTGWFDYWGQLKHSHSSPEVLEKTLNVILSMGGSFNLYMFIGGTNFGFTSGANNFSGVFNPMVTSYDYDAILTESGDVTAKYHVVRNSLLTFYKSIGIKGLPVIPKDTRKAHYGEVELTDMMEWDVFISLIPIAATDDKVNYMETYKDHNDHSNTLGYIVYSYLIGQDTHWNKMPGIQLTGEYKDRLTAILNSEIFYIQDDLKASKEDFFITYKWDEKFKKDHYEFMYDYLDDYYDVFNMQHWLLPFLHRVKNITAKMEKRGSKVTRRLDLMVENLGRVNFEYGTKENILNSQRKGLRGPVFRYIFGLMEDWNIRFLTFDLEQYKMLSKSMTWEKVVDVEQRRKESEESKQAPTLFRAYLTISGVPADTFLRLDGWTKGVVVINGFNLGRYWKIGPQRSLYVPAPILKSGINEIIVFEELKRGNSLLFTSTAVLD